MVGVILIILLVAAGVAVLVAAGTLVIQGYLYSEPVGGMAWRAPAVGAAVGLFYGLWCYIEAKYPGRYDTLWNFSTRETTPFDQFWSERTVGKTRTEVLYRRSRGDRGRVVYRDEDGQVWRRSAGGPMTAIIVEEGGQKVRFEAPLKPDGTFDVGPDGTVEYREVGGDRVMTEGMPGEVTRSRTGLLVGNLLWNLAHLAVWFLCFWLLLQFQWPHALGLAAIFWLVFALVVWPVLQGHVRAAAAAAPAPAVAPAP
jgi:hypothetical protein